MNKRMLLVGVGFLLLASAMVCYALAFNTHRGYYHTNWYKPHRWMTQECDRHNIPRAQCGLVVITVMGSVMSVRQEGNGVTPIGYVIIPVEQAKFDICLEHGELKRVQ